MNAGHQKKNLLFAKLYVFAVVALPLRECLKSDVQVALGDHLLLAVYAKLMRLNDNIRISLVKCGVNVGKHLTAAARRKADGKAALLGICHVIYEVVGALLDPQDFPGIVQINLSDLGGAHIYLAAVKKRCPKLLLQPQKLLV